MNNNPAFQSLQKITAVLLTTTSIFLTISIVFLVYFFYQDHKTQKLQAQLLAQHELQERLFASHSKDHVFYPHIDQNIGIVLNPSLEQSSWPAGDEDRVYPINSLGLRGEEIKAKRENVTRVVLASDSILFGWKLPESDTLATILNKHIGEKYDRENIEFITVAIPGWNTRSISAFLETHIDILSPDIIIWTVIPNDFDDVLGVIPPGKQSLGYSSQRKVQTPVHARDPDLRTLPLPFVSKRWDQNFDIMKSFSINYDIPILVLTHGPLFRILLSDYGKNLDYISVPGFYRINKLWRVEDNDSHPSAWANNILALGILRKLILLDYLPEVRFSDKEQIVIDEYVEREKRIFAKDLWVNDHTSSVLAELPNEYDHDGNIMAKRKGILYGLRAEDSLMSKQGLLYLRAERPATHILFDINIAANSEKYRRSVTFTIHNEADLQAVHTIPITAKQMKIELSLPEKSENNIYQISWQFDYSVCSSPWQCFSGNLLSATFLP